MKVHDFTGFHDKRVDGHGDSVVNSLEATKVKGLAGLIVKFFGCILAAENLFGVSYTDSTKSHRRLVQREEVGR